MEKGHKNNHIQRIKIINKDNNNLDYTEFLVKFFPKNNKNGNSLICTEREINIPKKISNQITEAEKAKFYENMKNKLEKEIKVIKQFSHPSIMKLIDYFEYPENVFHIITENYQCNLGDLIKTQINKKAYFSENTILSFFTQICLGIKYIHDLNILHRNINPSNILLISNKIIKISNFDCSRILYTSNERSITLVNNSWKEYISPEMSLNIPYSFKNDIWSLGILLFHMMALKVPFNFKQLNEIKTIKKVDPIFLNIKIPRHFSKDIKNLCIDLLKAFPAERPDINTILAKYPIIKNQIPIIEKINGGGVFNKNNIDNINKINIKKKIEDKNKTNFKAKFHSISKFMKINGDKKPSNNKINSQKIINLPKNNEEKDNNDYLKISVYENIKDKVKDPNNIIERVEPNIITGEIINISGNMESFDFNKLKGNNNTDKFPNNIKEIKKEA